MQQLRFALPTVPHDRLSALLNVTEARRDLRRRAAGVYPGTAQPFVYTIHEDVEQRRLLGSNWLVSYLLRRGPDNYLVVAQTYASDTLIGQSALFGYLPTLGCARR